MPAASDAGTPAARDVAGTGAHRLVVRGVGAAVVVAALLSALHAFATPPFAPPDETSHVAYALAITEGRRPLVTDFPDPGRVPLMRPGLSVWTANHPPLYHALAGVPLRLGEATGAGLAGFYAARLLSVLCYAAGVALVGCLLVVCVPHRPALAVSAAGITGTVPHFTHVAGIVYNDAAAFLLATATLLAGAAVLVRGPTRGRVALLAGAAAAAAATRVSGLLVLGLAGATAGVAPLLQRDAGFGVRLRRGVAHGAVVAASAAAAAGVFYVQNVVRYSGLTATATLLALFERQPRGMFAERLLWRGLWRDVHTQWWSRINESSHLPDVLLIPFRWWAPVIGVGLVVAAVRRLATRAWRPALPQLAAWALPLGLLAGTVLTFGLFVARGGSAHARYFMPALPAIGAIAAVGLGALPGARRGLPAAACTLSLLVAAVVTLRGFALHDGVQGEALAVKRIALEGGATAAVLAAVTLAVLAGAFAVYASALWRLGPLSAATAAGAVPAGADPTGTAGAGAVPAGADRLPAWRRDPAATALAALVCGVAGLWAASWYLPVLPGLAGGLGGLVVGPAALAAADRLGAHRRPAVAEPRAR